MILPGFILPTRANQTWQYSGIDSPDLCFDYQYFANYPWPVEYRFNSRGFRDDEWPQDLSQAVWCVGDSFTVGLGCPWDHTWPRVLAQKLDRRTINVSLDGASNDWMARKIIEISREIAPQWIVVQWSYTDRREHPDATLPDEERRIRRQPDATDRDSIINLKENINLVENSRGETQIIHSTIPMFSASAISRSLLLKKHCPANRWIPYFQNLDFARDSWHYDIKTSTWFAEQVSKIINL